LEKDKANSIVSILLTAPFPALREGLKALVESDGTISVAEANASPNEWGSHLLDYEVILLAPIGPVTAEWIKKISTRALEKPFLLLLAQPLADVPDLGAAIWGVLPFSATGQEMIIAIHALSQGLWIASPAALPYLVKPTLLSTIQDEAELVEPLTDRELEVLQCLAQGYTNKESALHLGISSQTIKFHVSSIYSKMGVNNRTEAVSAGVRMGWITL
jgi:NarL family two-component system response regulator YdfI